MRPNIAIGIDPGVDTGIAVWDVRAGRFLHIQTVKIHKAMETVSHMERIYNDVFVRVEDARKRKWYGKTTDKEDKAKAQGVGSIKRDCTIWEDFLSDNMIAHEMVEPKKLKTKMKEEYFKHVTGVTHRTSEHARDAAMQVFQLTHVNI